MKSLGLGTCELSVIPVVVGAFGAVSTRLEKFTKYIGITMKTEQTA